MRDPINFLKIHGIHAFVFQLVIGMRMVFILINPVLWATTYSYFAFHSTVGAYIESLYPAPVFYIAVFSLVFGNFLHFYNYMIGCAKRGHWNLIRYVFLIPFYWLFASLASVVAFYQLAVKPHFWEKTEHGLHLTKPAFTEIKFSFEFDTGFPKIAGNFIHGLFNPFVVLTKNVIDILDVFGPLPDLENKKGSMRILVLNWRDTKHVWAGGAEVYIQEVAKRWVRDGNNVTIFCGWDGKSLRNEAVDGVNIIRRGGFYTVYLFAFIYYQLRFKSSFDVIVDCENGIPFFTPLYADIPKVLLIHHVHQEVFRKHLPFPLSKIALFLESFLMPNLYRFIPIVTISKSSRDDIIRLGWGDEENVDIVNPGFSLQSDSRYLKTTYPSFLYLGRLKAYKNVDTAISAFAQINSKYKNSRLTIAGFGEDLPNLIRLIKRLKIEDSVTFAGKVDEGEKLKLLSESWVCLQPSSIEGWGITVIEANACGTPVIASDVKGLRDSVKNGETGFLVEPRNPDAFAAAMEYLISNSEKIRNLSMNAVFWSENFSWDKSSWELMTLLNREVGKNREFIPSLETVEDRR
jgi:glycosyltransferase involved in cell wall biosynthesis